MTRLIAFIIINLLTGPLYSQTVCEQINNWDKLNQAQQNKSVSLILSIYSKDMDVLDEFKIPISMTYYSTDLTKKYKEEYPNNETRSVIVGYVPLQFVEPYETELQKFYDDKDTLSKVPRLAVILAIHYTESNFIPSAENDTNANNPAFGMMQLTLRTAKDLYKRDTELYDDFFSIKDEKVIFASTQSQIELIINFLPDIKNYSRNNEESSITRYNGKGDEAKAYAALVLARARLYAKMKNSGKDIGRQQFIAEYSTPAVKKIINKQLEIKSYELLSDGDFQEAIERSILAYEYTPSSSSEEVVVSAINNRDIKTLPDNHVKFPPVPNDGHDYYLEIEAGRTLFSYFLNIKDMTYTMTNSKNDKFTLFYNTKSGKKIVKNLCGVNLKNNKMQSDVKAGDIIYIPSGIVIKGDNETMQNIYISRPSLTQQDSDVRP